MDIQFTSEDGEHVMATIQPETEFINGVMKGTVKYSCTTCMGDGHLLKQTNLSETQLTLKSVPCDNCNGKGFITEPCTITLPKDGK